MSIGGIGNSAASWAQFVKLTQAARHRNSGLGAEAAQAAKSAVSAPTQVPSMPQNVNAVSFKRVADVYLSSSASTQSAQMPIAVNNESLNRKIAGGLFDAYA